MMDDHHHEEEDANIGSLSSFYKDVEEEDEGQVIQLLLYQLIHGECKLFRLIIIWASL